MKLWTVIVLYKTPKQQLLKLVEQLRKAGVNKKQIYIKDNSAHNLGFAKAVNLGLKTGLKQGFSNFVVLNPDIRLIKFNYQEVENGFNNFDIFGGIFKQGSKTYYRGIIDPIYLSGGLNYKKPSPLMYPTDFVSGSMMFLNKQAILKNGFLNTKYFLYYEDVDYCYNAKKKGLKIGINSKIKYEHFEDSKNNSKKKTYLTKSHELFLNKYGAWWQKWAYWLKKINDR